MNQDWATQSLPGKPLKGTDIPESVFESSWSFISATRDGLPGAVVRQAISALGYRELFADILEVPPSKLSRVYQLKQLNKSDSGSVLDTLQVFREASRTFECQDLVDGWLSVALPILGGQRPIDLCNPFEGRDLIRATMRKIRLGDFS